MDEPQYISRDLLRAKPITTWLVSTVSALILAAIASWPWWALVGLAAAVLAIAFVTHFVNPASATQHLLWAGAPSVAKRTS